MSRKAALNGAGVDAAPGRTWYTISNKAGDATEVFLYDEIGAWGVAAGEFIKDLKAVAGPVDLHINSPGGDVFDGVAIYNALRAHRGDVNVTVDGLAASAASFVAMAGDTVCMARNAQLMIHEAHAIAAGSAKDMTAMADLLGRCSDNIAAIYADRAGGSTAEWRDRMRTETWYTADEAVKAGLADSVAPAPTRTGSPRNAITWDLSIFNFNGRDAAPDPFAVDIETEPDAVEAPPAIQPEPEPEPVVELAAVPTPPTPEPAQPVVDFDPEVFRAAVNASLELPFDPDAFRDTLRGMAGNAPALPTSTRRPVDLGPPLPPATLAPEPPPDIGPWDQVRAAVHLAANDAPAPPQPHSPTTESPADEPGFFMDATAFRNALRGATL